MSNTCPDCGHLWTCHHDSDDFDGCDAVGCTCLRANESIFYMTPKAKNVKTKTASAWPAVNGPLAGDWITEAVADNEGYVRYNAGIRTGKRGRNAFPSCVFVHMMTLETGASEMEDRITGLDDIPVATKITPTVGHAFGPASGAVEYHDFITALDNFEAMLTKVVQSRDTDEYGDGSGLTELQREDGRLYVKYITKRWGSRSVHCFVRKDDGAILKAASFKAPFIAKGGPMAAETIRGSIYAKDCGASAVNWSGVNYI